MEPVVCSVVYFLLNIGIAWYGMVIQNRGWYGTIIQGIVEYSAYSMVPIHHPTIRPDGLSGGAIRGGGYTSATGWTQDIWVVLDVQVIWHCGSAWN